MSTAQEIIDSARYDLEDYQSGIMWDSTELLNYLNRMIGIMNSQLVALNSELVEAEELDIDCVADQNYVDLSAMNSGLWSNIRAVWLDQDLLEQTTVDSIRYKRIYREDSSQQPYYWALQNQQIMFEVDCASAYTTLRVYYNKKQVALTLTDDMPYEDMFNDTFIEMLNLYAQSKKTGNVSSMNGIMRTVFNKRAMEETVRRNFVRKSYYIDF